MSVGLLILAAGLILNLWFHNAYAESASGFLIGMSIIFIIFGFVGRSRTTAG